MKRFKMLTVLAVAAIFITACGKDNNPEPPVIEDGTYVGTMTVYNGIDGQLHYQQNNVSIKIEKGDGNIVNIEILQVKFDERMPMTIDVTIPEVTTVDTETGFSLSADNIIPIAMGSQSDNFKMNDLNGSITRQSMTFSVVCDIKLQPILTGIFPLSFTGTKAE